MGVLMPVRTITLSWPGTAAAVATSPGKPDERSTQSPAAVGCGGAGGDEDDDDDVEGALDGDEEDDDEEVEAEDDIEALVDEPAVTAAVVICAGAAGSPPPPQLFRMSVPRQTPTRYAHRRMATAVRRTRPSRNDVIDPLDVMRVFLCIAGSE
jgi:hypothetical protein